MPVNKKNEHHLLLDEYLKNVYCEISMKEYINNILGR